MYQYIYTLMAIAKCVLIWICFQESGKQHRMKVVFDGTQVVDVPVVDGNVQLQMKTQDMDQPVVLCIPKQTLSSGCHLATSTGSLVKVAQAEDDLNGYVSSFLQCYFLVLFFKDAICEGDIDRINISLKLMIPYFYAHSRLSKYLVECMDYIIKTEKLLPPATALQIQTSSLVNPRGGRGSNRPMDQLKENQVKTLKDLIRGLGANKTEKSVVDISKAGPYITDVVSNLDSQIAYNDFQTRHKARDDQEDLGAILETLQTYKPLSFTPGRKLAKYPQMKENVFQTIQEKEFLECLSTISSRLLRNSTWNIVTSDSEGEDEEDEQ